MLHGNSEGVNGPTFPRHHAEPDYSGHVATPSDILPRCVKEVQREVPQYEQCNEETALSGHSTLR